MSTKEDRTTAAREALADAAKKKTPRVDPGFDVGQEAFMQEMEAAEAGGDLPPAEVRGGLDLRGGEVIRSMEGGETPTQAVKTYEETIAGRDKRGEELGQRMESIMAKVQPSTRSNRMDQSEFASVMALIADGKVTLVDPELQKEAFDVATALREVYKHEGNPEGYIPSYGYSGGNKARDLYEESGGVRRAVEKGELK
tara:strand:- start:672 stop:1265 length:594 start_codon:yes stop_codon:yes gene_type:complete